MEEKVNCEGGHPLRTLQRGEGVWSNVNRGRGLRTLRMTYASWYFLLFQYVLWTQGERVSHMRTKANKGRGRKTGICFWNPLWTTLNRKIKESTNQQNK